MTLFFYKLLAIAVLIIVTLVAVVYPIRARILSLHNHFLDLGDAFASGVFLGAALFHLLPEANSYFETAMPTVHYPVVNLLCAAGFVLLLFLERLTLSNKKNSHNTIPYILAVVVMVHSLIEGAVLGVSVDITTFSVIFLAVIAHKSSESFALSAMLAKSRLSLSMLVLLIFVFCLMTPFGILLGSSVVSLLQVQKGQLIAAGFNAFAAGTFLYMSTLHHINHHQRLHDAESLVEFFFLLMGLVLMGVIALWV